MSYPLAMGEPWPFLGLLATTAIWIGFIFWLAVHRQNARTAKVIVRRLKKTGQPYTVKASYMRGVWNPAKRPGFENAILERGIATYSLDDNGLVHLRFTSTSGHELHLSGAVPDSAIGSTAEHQHARSLMRRAVLGYISLLAVGASMGAAVDRGDVADHVLGAVVGLFAAMVAAVLLVWVVRVGKAVRDITRR